MHLSRLINVSFSFLTVYCQIQAEYSKTLKAVMNTWHTCFKGEGFGISGISLFPVLVSKWWSHLCVRCVCVCVCSVCLSVCRMPLLVGQVSLNACASAAGATYVCVCVLFTSWLGGSGQGSDAMCRVLSSLYSNDRPCCFTCCAGRSVALSLHPLSKTRTQVLPAEITWIRPSTK